MAVEKGQGTAVRISGTDVDVFTASEATMLRYLRSLGGGIYFYDMLEPVFVVETSFSYYIIDDLAIGGFVALDKYPGLGKSGLQVTFGDTRDIAAGLRVAFFYPQIQAGNLQVYIYKLVQTWCSGRTGGKSSTQRHRALVCLQEATTGAQVVSVRIQGSSLRRVGLMASRLDTVAGLWLVEPVRRHW
ncbi:hypothetical protein ACFLSW_03795 [Candidatus Bipolaricaulota bacterium]